MRMAEIIGTDEFEAWYLALSEEDVRAVDRLVGLLEAQGVQLGHPYSSALLNTKYAIRELRHRGASNPIRILYIFDKTRAAILLVAGNKKSDDRFYERMVPLAERVWEQYAKEQHH